MIPSFLLKKVYIHGSLRNTESGFSFALKNVVDTGTLVGVGSLVVDGKDYMPASITIKTNRGEWTGDQINYRNPIVFAYGSEAQFLVQGEPLAPGPHHLVLAAIAGEVGRLQLEMDDTIA